MNFIIATTKATRFSDINTLDLGISLHCKFDSNFALAYNYVKAVKGEMPKAI